MASPALNHFEVEELKASILSEPHVGPVLATSVCEAFAPTQDSDSLSVPTSAGLKGAKGAMWAFGIEAAVALCFYGIWQLWHILR